MAKEKIFIDGLMHLGDIILTSSAVREIKKMRPQSEITYFSTSNMKDVVSLLPDVDRFIPYDYVSKGGVAQAFQVASQLRKEHYDLGISLDPRERVTLIKWLAGIPRRISAERALGWELKWERLFYTDDLRLDGWNYQEHRMAESFYEIFRRFFHDTDGTYLPPVFKPSAKADLQAVEDMLQQAFHAQGIAPAKRVAFCVQTTNERKDWRPERFAKLADRLIERCQAAIILTGIPSHAARARQVLDHMKHPEYAVDLIGKTTFLQAVALCRKIDLYVTLDTGNTHIAAAAGCPVVTIFSYNSPAIYGGSSENCRTVSAGLPCSGKHICNHPRECPKTDCFDFVTVDQVWDAIQSLNL
jgi:heptosyltransferase-2